MTLHWKITVSGDSRQVEMELRNLDQTDRQLSLEGESAPYRVVSRKNLSDAMITLFVSNLVKCKKLETFKTENYVRTIRDEDPSSMPSKSKEIFRSTQQFWLKANPGLDAPKLSAEFDRLFKITPAELQTAAANTAAPAAAPAGSGFAPKDPAKNYAGTPCEPFTQPATPNAGMIYGTDSIVVYGKRAYRCEAQNGQKLWTLYGPREKLGKDWKNYEAARLEQ